ncbi:MAG: (d)CMP kinase [Phycisphaeraceae bacterium]|nr:(d)CMP kinase [Phycisphaeraceae bacterium]
MPESPGASLVNLEHVPVLSVPLPNRPIIITIDGPAGTGKSTVASQLSRRLGIDVLDTGAMYRAAAAIVIDRGIALDDVGEIVRVVAEADLHFDWTRRPPAVLAWDRPLNDRIRRPDVSAIVSIVAAIPELRAHMVRKQRLIAQQHPRIVSEGRDQGSAVFPDADVKFYLDARAPVRAQRRADELTRKGITTSQAEQLEMQRERDRLDSTREVGPLTRPADAIYVDTTDLTPSQVVARLERETLERLEEDDGAGDAAPDS